MDRSWLHYRWANRALSGGAFFNRKSFGQFLGHTFLAVAIWALCVLAGPAAAQNAQGTILGHVTDPSGAVIPGAQVTVTNKDTGVATAVTTNGTGDFTVPALNPGNYSVTVEDPGSPKARDPGHPAPANQEWSEAGLRCRLR
jgi:hypothetical protein